MGDGALVGLLAGLLGAVVNMVVSVPMNMLTGPFQQQIFQRLVESQPDLPENVRQMVDSMGGGAVSHCRRHHGVPHDARPRRRLRQPRRPARRVLLQEEGRAGAAASAVRGGVRWSVPGRLVSGERGEARGEQSTLASQPYSLSPFRRRYTGVVISVAHLSKKYGNFIAVDDLSFEVARRRGAGLPRPQRRGQDDDDADGHRVPAAVEGPRAHRRIRPLRPAHPGQAEDRVPAGEPAALPGDDGAPLPALRGRAQGRARRPGEGRRRRGRSIARGSARWRTGGFHAVEGLPAARRPGAGHRARAAGAHAGRTDIEPRPEAALRGPRTHRGAQGPAHGHPLDAHPARGQRGRRPRRHHQPRKGDGRRHAGANLGERLRARDVVQARDWRRRRAPTRCRRAGCARRWPRCPVRSTSDVDTGRGRHLQARIESEVGVDLRADGRRAR